MRHTWYPQELIAVDHYDYIFSATPIKPKKRLAASTTATTVLQSLPRDGVAYLTIRIVQTDGTALAWWQVEVSGWIC